MKPIPLIRYLISFGSGMLLVCFSLSACGTTPTHHAPAHDSKVQLKNRVYSVETATDAASREQGLMYRTSLAANHGMLFIFPAPEKLTFWMKNTLIPLDILFFDSQYRLTNVHQHVPPCKTEPCPVYSSIGPSQYVLELNAGEVEKLGVNPGDELAFSEKILPK